MPPPTVKKPTTPFPKYSGSLDTFPFFVMRLNSYKADPYFAAVTDWTVTTATSVNQSKRIHDDMFEVLPSKYLHQFLDQPMFAGRGIEMLVALLNSIHPNNPAQRLLDIQNLAALQQKPTESTDAFMMRVRGFSLGCAVSPPSRYSLFLLLMAWTKNDTAVP